MLKIEKFKAIRMPGGMHISPEMLKLGRVTKVKMLFLVLVFIF